MERRVIQRFPSARVCLSKSKVAVNSVCNRVIVTPDFVSNKSHAECFAVAHMIAMDLQFRAGRLVRISYAVPRPIGEN